MVTILCVCDVVIERSCVSGGYSFSLTCPLVSAADPEVYRWVIVGLGITHYPMVFP